MLLISLRFNCYQVSNANTATIVKTLLYYNCITTNATNIRTIFTVCTTTTLNIVTTTATNTSTSSSSNCSVSNSNSLFFSISISICLIDIKLG